MNIMKKKISTSLVLSVVLIFTFVFSFVSINKVFAYSLTVTGITPTGASVGGGGFAANTSYEVRLMSTGVVSAPTLSTNSAGVFGYLFSNLNPNTLYLVGVYNPGSPGFGNPLITKSFTTSQASLPNVTFNANPSFINPGQSASLTWSSTNATSCTAGGGWSGNNKPVSGSQSVSPTATTTYTLSCTGSGGTTPALSQTITVGATNPLLAPTSSVPSGTYSTNQSIVLSTVDTGSFVHFTTNGTNPTCSSPQYSNPISIATTTTVNAVSCNGTTASTPASFAYTITPTNNGTPVYNDENPLDTPIYNDENPPVPADAKIKNPIKYDDINSFIKALLAGAIKIGIPIIALAIIFSGFLFVEARGNEAKLKVAKDAFMYTCIGAAILLGAWSIALLINETILAL